METYHIFEHCAETAVSVLRPGGLAKAYIPPAWPLHRNKELIRDGAPANSGICLSSTGSKSEISFTPDGGVHTLAMICVRRLTCRFIARRQSTHALIYT
jgi:hypothetical protein